MHFSFIWRRKIRHWSSKSLNMFNMPISHFSRLLSLWWLPYTQQANVYQQQQLLYFCFYPSVTWTSSLISTLCSLLRREVAVGRQSRCSRPLRRRLPGSSHWPATRYPRRLSALVYWPCRWWDFSLSLDHQRLCARSIACYSRWRLIQLNIRETPHAAVEPTQSRLSSSLAAHTKAALFCVLLCAWQHHEIPADCEMINWLVHFSDYLEFLPFILDNCGDACCHHPSRNSFSQ